VCMKYSTCFMIALDADETFLKGGRICLCWLAGKVYFTHNFLRSVTFGVISTTE